MTRKTKRTALIIIVVLGGSGLFVTYGIPLLSYGISHHLEAQLPSNLESVELQFGQFKDTNLTVSFVDDESLFYRIDFTLYEPATLGDAISLEYFDDWYWFQTVKRMRTMTIVLGTGIPYSIFIGGDTPLNSTFIFDNGANFTEVNNKGSDIDYYAAGILRLDITENIVVGTHMDIHTGATPSRTPDTVLLDIDLPTGIHGVLRVGTGPISFSVLDGWYFRGSGRYSTSPNLYAIPYIGIEVYNSDHVYASLRD